MLGSEQKGRHSGSSLAGVERGNVGGEGGEQVRMQFMLWELSDLPPHSKVVCDQLHKSMELFLSKVISVEVVRRCVLQFFHVTLNHVFSAGGG